MLNNIFSKSAVSLFKIVVLAYLAYLFVGIFFAKNQAQLIVGLFVLVFITLPTVFMIFFEKKFLPNHQKFAIFWKIYKIFYVIIVVLYIVLWGVGAYRSNNQIKTQETIDFINSRKITLDDVMGKNLPPKPDQEKNDSTIAGIDANNNYIRDDVELAIFEKYPDSAKIRAAELQYAQALQLELTQVYNSETLVATIRKESSAYNCLGDSIKNIASFNLDEKEAEAIKIILNTDSRANKQTDDLKKYMTTYSLLPGQSCDVELSPLPN